MKKSLIVFSICFLFFVGVTGIVSSTEFTEFGTYNVKVDDSLSIGDCRIFVNDIGIDERDDPWYDYLGEPMIYLGGAGVGYTLHEGETDKILVNKMSRDYCMQIKINSISLEEYTSSITIISLDQSFDENSGESAGDIEEPVEVEQGIFKRMIEWFKNLFR
jgi:hypothetical protein